MDIDLLKSSSYCEEDQMEMMLMMQMENIEMPILDYSPRRNDDNNNNNNISHNSFSQIIDHIPSTISFNGSRSISSQIVHDQESSITLPFVLDESGTSGTNFNNGKWRSTTSVRGDYKEQVSNTVSYLNVFPSRTSKRNSMVAMREMIFRIAAMQPIQIDPASVKPPKRKNVKISSDPQSVAARHRRERISEKIRILQRLVPGGTKMDTASMLDEAIHYMKFLKNQVQSLEKVEANRPINNNNNNNNNNNLGCLGFPVPMSLSGNNYYPYHQSVHH